MAARAMLAIGRTGGIGSDGSGDYAIAFSSVDVRGGLKQVSNDDMTPLFLAVIEATEEAIYNSLFRATMVTGNGHTAEALPIDKTLEILREHKVMQVPSNR